MRIAAEYQWHTGKLKKPVLLAVVSDLHGEAYEDIWQEIEGADCLLVPGDVVNRYKQRYREGAQFLKEAAKRLPTFFSMGNHEMRIKARKEMLEALESSGATILWNDYVSFGELWIGGWYRPAMLKMPDMLDDFEQLEGCKVLMCHRPEDYRRYLKGRQLDLVLAGHAHGGQIRLREQGIYAPGQGFFPRYTRGVVDERMIVSAGAGNPAKFPRWGNPCEILRITLD